MEPRIQYCTASDGVRIAYWTLGEGPPLVQLPSVPISHLQLEWQNPDFRRWYELLARDRMLIRYDGRGLGLSDRVVRDQSLEAQLLDLDAVVGRVGLDTLALLALNHAGPTAIAYATAHQARVSRLVLWATYAKGTEWAASPHIKALRQIAATEWDTFTHTVAHLVLGWSEPEAAQRLAELAREAVSPESFQAFMQVYVANDVSALLPRITCPTLVCHRRDALIPHMDVVRDLASGIPNASFVLLEGKTALPWIPDPEQAFGVISAFLGESRPGATEVALPAPGAVHTILFTDLASSTALTQRLGDAQAQELVRAHNAIVREGLAAHGGSEIKHTGDGIMASFPTASGALECAVAIQRAVGAREDADLQVHIGLNAGEPVAEESDLFGTSVQLARRICDHAQADQILVSNVVRELAAGKGFLFADIGEVVPKGFEEPVRLYEVRWRE